MFVINKTDEFEAWLEKLADRLGKAIILARLTAAEQGKLGDWKTIKSELCEMRVHFGPGYRLYFVKRKNVLIVMLAGGSKSTQVRDIRKAERILGELEIDDGKD
jgi:putative addiction module killer protein